MITSNSFEGGTNTVAISAANSGEPSGKAFSVIATNTATLTYSTSTRNSDLSSMCAKHLVTSQSVGASRYEWGSAVITPASTTMYLRMYINLAVHPAGYVYFLRFLTGASTVAHVRFNTSTNVIELVNSLNTVVEATSSTALTLNTWYRFEVQVVSHATDGSISARLYSSTESDTILESFATDNTVNTNGGAIDLIHVGFTGVLVTNNNTELYTDDIAIDNVNWIGPINPLHILTSSKFFKPQATYRM